MMSRMEKTREPLLRSASTWTGYLQSLTATGCP